MSSRVKNELLRVNNQLCNFSADGKYIALAFQAQLIIKDTTTLNVVHTFVFPSVIEYIEWSADSQYILCANMKSTIVQVFSISCTQWKCKLTEGSAGLEAVTWSPDSKHIITVADFRIQLSIWSLETQSVVHIQNLKSSANDRLEFSPNGKRLALLGTDEGEDYVEIYRTDTWKISRKLICERLGSINGLCWSPNSELLSIWSSVSKEPKLLVYSNITEKNIAVFQPNQFASEVLLEQAKSLVGLDVVKWNPTGQLLAISGFNEMVLLINHVTWKPLLQLYLEPVITDNNYMHKVYKECIIKEKESDKHSKHTLEGDYNRPLNIHIGKSDLFGKYSVAKIDVLEFSACGRFLAIKHQVYPTTLLVWDIITDTIEYLLLQNTVVAARWNPLYAQLLIFCESTHYFVWTQETAKCLATPHGITVLDARWHPNGNTVLFCGYNKAVVFNMKDVS